MKISRFFTALLALIILACSFGVQGQYTTTQSQTTSIVASSNGTSSSVNSQYTQSSSQYTQYYNMPSGSAPRMHISASVPFDITAKTPSNVNLGSQNQAMPYAQYISSTNAGAYSLWIQGATNWTQYVSVPQGATVTLIAISPAGGKGYLNELTNGLMYNFDQTFYTSSQITFFADTVGLHTLYFMLNGQPSNKVTIYVTGTSNYVPYNYYGYDYYPGYYQDYYPGYYSGYPRYYRDYGQTVSYNFGYSGY
jgi:hypothetical protein